MKTFRNIVTAVLIAGLLVVGAAFADETFNFKQGQYYSPNPSTVKLVSTTYSVLTTDHMVNGDASSAAFTMTLPPIKTNGLGGKDYIFNKIDTSRNAITIAASTTDSVTNTIEGKTTRIIQASSGLLVIKAIGYDWKVSWETPPIDVDMTIGEAYTYKSREPFRVFTTPTVSATLTHADCGKTYLIGTDALTMTLPTNVAGCAFEFINIGAAGAAILDVKAPATGAFAGTLMNPGAAAVGTGPGVVVSSSTGSTLSNTKATAKQGDSVKIVSLASTTWIITRNTGTWTTK